MTGLLYRWEEHNHGLEHKCGTCATVLSSPRAKKTCFGVHEEVCTRYHKTLFYVGQSNHCDACHKTIELHDKRHREIAAIVQNIQSLDGINDTANPLHDRKRKNRRKTDWDAFNIDAESKDGSQEREPEWDDQSSTLNDDEAEETKLQWNADARKAAKTERKTSKNQGRFKVITQEDLDKIQGSLHPELSKTQANHWTRNGQGLANNKIIQDNIAFGKHTFNWSSLRKGIYQKKLAKANDPKKQPGMTAEEENEILSPILARLDVKTTLTKATKERKSLDNKLRTAIIEDLVALDNEKAETMQRMAGYWRYANRRTYNQMVKNNELWDWATGQKLPEIEEESELDSIEEEDEEDEERCMSNGNLQGVSSPESWDDDADLDLPEDSSALSLAQRFKRMSFGTDDDPLRTPTQWSFKDSQGDLVDFARDRMDGRSMPKLSSSLNSPIRSPGLTSGSSAASPYSDDDGYEAFWDIPVDASTNQPRSPLAPKPSNAKPSLFQGKKDHRSLRNGRLVHEASPPPEDSSSQQRRPLRHFPPPGTILPNAVDIGNRYGHLDNDTPAPCEEKSRTPVKPAVLVIPRQSEKPQADAEAVTEAGWELQGGRRKRPSFPPLVKKAAENARKAGNSNRMNFAGAAKKNL